MESCCDDVRARPGGMAGMVEDDDQAIRRRQVRRRRRLVMMMIDCAMGGRDVGMVPI